MRISYSNLSKDKRNFQDITGLKVEKFQKVEEKVRPEWGKNGSKEEMPW